MIEDIRKFARLGLVHHMLYPKCVSDSSYHADTLIEFSKRDDIETFDCCIPYDIKERQRTVNALQKCEKEKCYALHLFPARKISLCSLDKTEQEITKLVISDQIKAASDINAKSFVFVSGADVPDARKEAKKAFLSFCRWFCAELSKYNITALLEPFDRTIDKKYLYGPIDECIELIDEVSQDYMNIGIELDVAHLPLMGEEFESAIKRCGNRIKRVHIGNCVLCDTNDLWYGDKHPPVCFKEGAIAEPELSIILRALLDIGYLSEDERGALIMEMQPYPGTSVEYTVNHTMDILSNVWRQL